MHEKQCPGGHWKQCVLSASFTNKSGFLLEHLQNAAVGGGCGRGFGEMKLSERERGCVSSLCPQGGEAVAVDTLNLNSSSTPGLSQLAVKAASRPLFLASFTLLLSFRDLSFWAFSQKTKWKNRMHWIILATSLQNSLSLFTFLAA